MLTEKTTAPLSSARPALVSLSALALGALAYLLRSGNVLAVSWLDAVGMRASALAHVASASPSSVHARALLPRWLLGSFPDFAFAIAVGAAMARAPHVYRAAGLLLAVSYELAQGLHLAPGTFDPIDLLVTILGYPLGQRLALSGDSHVSDVRNRHEARPLLGRAHWPWSPGARLVEGEARRQD